MYIAGEGSPPVLIPIDSPFRDLQIIISVYDTNIWKEVVARLRFELRSPAPKASNQGLFPHLGKKLA